MAKKKPDTKNLIGKALESDGAKDDRTTIEQVSKKEPTQQGRPRSFEESESVRVTFRIHEATNLEMRQAFLLSEHRTISVFVDELIRKGLEAEKGE